MRLDKVAAQVATEELVEMIRQHPGQRTKELRGTRRFHGTRTLSARQIHRLLDAEPSVYARVGGTGMYTWLEWFPKAA